MNTVIGIFDDPMAARRAMERLRDGPLMLDDISLISRNTKITGASGEDVSAGEGAAVGAVWGGLVGLGALLIPGIGPFVAGGALFAALTGAVTGAVVGGIAAALIDFSGIPQEDARGYEAEVNNGKTLVAVRVHDEDTAEVHSLLTEDGASAVRDSVHESDAVARATTPPRIAMYDASGKRVEQPELAGVAAATSHRYGYYDTPDGAWTGGEVVGEGQGSGPRRDTGKYDADQWVGEGQGPGKTPGDTWTSGEFVGEGQGDGPRADTGEYNSKQWVGEGQGDKPAS